jgi:hypothetical protein
MGVTPLDGPLLLPSGHHVLRAIREGHEPAQRQIDVISGEQMQVLLSPRPRPKAVTTAKLLVTSYPAGAQLIVDGKPVGSGPWSATLQPGGHEIRATLKGYEKTKQEVVLTAGQERSFVVELSPLPPPPKWYKRWYIWTVPVVVLLGAAGAGVGGYIATHPQPDLRLDFK